MFLHLIIIRVICFKKTQLAGIKDAKIVEIEDMPEMEAIQDYCKSLTGARSVPRVWISGKFIGGGDEVERAFKKGDLQKMA